VVVSFAALRMSAPYLAVGNLLGSNIFNIFILGIDDLFYRNGPLFLSLDSANLFSVFIVIIMSSVVGLGLLFKPGKKQLWLFSLDTFIIILLYFLLVIYLFIKI